MLDSLSGKERESSVVYLDVRGLPAETVLEIDGREIHLSRPSMMAFIDLQPTANWGHACRYLFLIRIPVIYKRLRPIFRPFLRGVHQTLRVIWQGSDAPDWAVALGRPSKGGA